MQKESSQIKLDPFFLEQYKYVQTECEIDSKERELKQKVARFKNIHNLEDAQKLVKEILPTAIEHSFITVGNLQCKVLNSNDTLRIIIDSPTEFISYDFKRVQ